MLTHLPAWNSKSSTKVGGVFTCVERFGGTCDSATGVFLPPLCQADTTSCKQLWKGSRSEDEGLVEGIVVSNSLNLVIVYLEDQYLTEVSAAFTAQTDILVVLTNPSLLFSKYSTLIKRVSLPSVKLECYSATNLGLPWSCDFIPIVIHQNSNSSVKENGSRNECTSIQHDCGSRRLKFNAFGCVKRQDLFPSRL